jgi:hypothetical protein
LDYWQLGNKVARERGPGYVTAATMKTLPEVRRRMQTHGWAVMDNMCELFDASCKPSKEQSEYILKTNEDNKQVIFDNAYGLIQLPLSGWKPRASVWAHE